MAISSPFRKLSHSRDNSKEDSAPVPPQQRNVQLQGKPYSRTTPAASRSNSRQMHPVARDPTPQLKKSNTMTSTASATSISSTALAQQYESDKQRLIKYCFSALGPDGVVMDSYITHVRVIEDAAYPSNKPPSSSPASNKKPRVLALAVKKDGTVYLHKGRENPNGSFQIGRVWSLNELTKIVREPTREAGFLCNLGKDYYWETNTPRERQVFITSFVRVYRKFKNGLVPQLINWDLSLFGLDENSYKNSLNKDTLDPSVRNGSVSSQTAARSSRSGQSPAVVQATTQSPKVISQQPSPKKKPSVASSAAPLASPAASSTSTPPLSSSSTNLQVRSQTVDSYAKQPKPLISEKRRPSVESSTKRPSVDPSTRRPSVSDPYARNPSTTSSLRPRAAALPPLNVDVPMTRPLDLSRPSTQQSKPSSSDSSSQKDITQDATSSSDLERQINEEMKRLGLEEPAEASKSKSIREAQAALDIPQRYDPPSTGDPENESLERSTTQESSALSVSQTIKSVEIVAHRRSMMEFEKAEELDDDEDDDDEDDYDYDDDITALYQDSSDQLDSSVIHPVTAQPVTVEPTTPENDSQDFSFENSYDEEEPSVEMINATPRAMPTETPTTIKANAQSDDDDDYDDLNSPAVEMLDVPRSQRMRHRANTVDSVMDGQDTDRSSFDDIFEEINWDTSDDAETLTIKLMKELAETEYETTRKLIEVCGQSNQLQAHTQKINTECSKLKPLLNFFAVELTGFARDIQHVENEGQGLQVETINKKQLRNDLQTLLNTVSVDDRSLDILISADIDRDLARLEPVLTELESAIDAIRGGNNEEDDLGNMRALRERRAKYESMMGQFMRKMKSDLERTFQYVLGNLDETSTDKDISKRLSMLIIYASITLFMRNMSDEYFYDLVSSWESHISPLYENILGRFNSVVIEKTKKDEKFSLSSNTAYKSNIAVPIQKKSALETKQNKLRETFGLSEPSSPMDIDVPSTGKQIDGIEVYQASLQTVLNHVILQQDFLTKFFHMSSAEMPLAEYVEKHPIDSRQSLLNSTIGEIDFDRSNARDISSTIGAIFQPSLDTLQKSIVHGLRNNQKNTPGVMLWIELFEKQFASSNQEYLLAQFKKMADRLSVDWEKFVDIEVKTIEKTTLAQRATTQVSILVKNFCTLAAETEKMLAATLVEYPIGGVIVKSLETGRQVEKAYVEISRAIVANLSQEFEEKFSRFKLHDASETKDKRNYLVNLAQNSNWVIESLTPLKLSSLNASITGLQNIFNSSKDQYVKMLVEQNFGKVASFVSDVKGLLEETAPKHVDPSKRNAYSKSALNKLLSGFSSREVNKIVNEMRKTVLHHFEDPEKSEIQRMLVEKIWSALQAEFVSITMDLDTIAQRYYKDVDVNFTKKDIIAAFNASRISH